MKKKRTWMQAVKETWGLLTIAGTLISGLVGTTLKFQAERDALDRQLWDACMRIETLEHVVTEQFPAYSASFYYRKRPECE